MINPEDLEDLKEQFRNASHEELKDLCRALQENLAEIDAVAPTDEVIRLTLEAHRILISDALELARIAENYIQPH